MRRRSCGHVAGTIAYSNGDSRLTFTPSGTRGYADLRREEFELSGELRMPTSALLPMGGAVSGFVTLTSPASGATAWTSRAIAIAVVALGWLGKAPCLQQYKTDDGLALDGHGAPASEASPRSALAAAFELEPDGRPN